MQGAVGDVALARVQPLLVEAFRGSEAEIRSRLDRWLPELRGHEPVLDLGCGAGEPIARWFMSEGFSVTGVDFSAAMLGIARARWPQGTWYEAVPFGYVCSALGFHVIDNPNAKSYGVPPAKVQFHDVGLFSERSVKSTLLPSVTVVGVPSKSATGGCGTGAVKVNW